MLKYISTIAALNICFFALAVNSFTQSVPTAQAETVRMSSEKLQQIDALVYQAIANKKMPGAVVLVGRKGKIVFRKAYGKRSLVPTVENMTVDTIFDLASLTKPIATATSIMILVEEGKLRLNDKIGKYIPEIEDKNARQVTIKQLLTHISGYSPSFDLRKKWVGRNGMLETLKTKKLRNVSGTKFVYSDIGFVILGEIVKRITERDLSSFYFNSVVSRLGFDSTFFIKPSSIKGQYGKTLMSDIIIYPQNSYRRFAPTQRITGDRRYYRSDGLVFVDKKDGILKGFVHDPTAYRMNGVSGNAGLFSTADDLAKYCQMLLNGGILDGKRLLSPATIAKMTKPQVVSEKGDARGLGWDINTRFSSNRGEFFPIGSFGHTGWTGTGLWIDPLSETFVVFLSNRVHPDGKGTIVEVRAKISTLVASSIEDITPNQIRSFEEKYLQQIDAGTLRFIKEKKAIAELPVGSRRKPIKNLGISPKLKVNQAVLNGIDVLEQDNFTQLNGLKVGLVTNHTGKNLVGKSTIDILNEAKNVKLVSLFAPEHGIRGKLDQAKIDDSIDKKTGLRIYSLYGKSRRPKAEQLQNLDALVFDIQDIGTRFYTYISTLRYLLEEAAKANKKVYVLDRPNPINGVDVAGSIADADKLSFVATHTLPIRHGMTIGEIALLMNKERHINADLKIVKMQNWQRSVWFDETQQTWINPSPNMRSLTQATLYPGVGLLETTNLSVGRGTDTPFEIIGSPWINGRKLARHLNAKRIKGVRFIPISFTPKSSVFKNKVCYGINILITNRDDFEPVETGFELALSLRKLYPKDWQMKSFNRLLADDKVFGAVSNQLIYSQLKLKWEDELNRFKSIRRKFLLYK